LLALLQPLQQTFRLIDVLFCRLVIGVKLQYVAPLGDGGL
jgi:hypothetical protein